MKKRNILAVGAHPDDVELGCGGVLAKHLELGDEVFVLVLTNGEKGNHTLNREECWTSLTALGIVKENIFFGNFPDAFLKDDYDSVNWIESYIKKFNITRVYTHSPHDRHQDHRNCSNAVSSAARKVAEIFLFQGPSTNVSFEPHLFVEISEANLKQKVVAVSYYKTQIHKGVFDVNAIQGLAKSQGAKHHTGYAEAFAINHMLRPGDEL